MKKSLEFCRKRMRQIAEELWLPEEEKKQIDEMFIDNKKDWEESTS